MTENKTPPIFDTVNTAWLKVKGAKATIWAAGGLLILITLTFWLLVGIAIDWISVPLALGINLLSKIIFFILFAGLLYVGIRRAFDLPLSYKQLFFTLKDAMPFKLIGMYLLKIIILYIPVILIAIAAKLISTFVYHSPTILLPHWLFLATAILLLCISIRMILAVGFLLERNANPWQAIKLSFIATRSNFFRIVAFFLIGIVILLISLIPLGLGLIWSLPFLVILYGEVYKGLS